MLQYTVEVNAKYEYKVKHVWIDAMKNRVQVFGM